MSRVDAITTILLDLGRSMMLESFQYRVMARAIRCNNVARGKYPSVSRWFTKEELQSN